MKAFETFLALVGEVSVCFWNASIASQLKMVKSRGYVVTDCSISTRIIKRHLAIMKNTRFDKADLSLQIDCIFNLLMNPYWEAEFRFALVRLLRLVVSRYSRTDNGKDKLKEVGVRMGLVVDEIITKDTLLLDDWRSLYVLFQMMSGQLKNRLNEPEVIDHHCFWKGVHVHEENFPMWLGGIQRCGHRKLFHLISTCLYEMNNAVLAQQDQSDDLSIASNSVSIYDNEVILATPPRKDHDSSEKSEIPDSPMNVLREPSP